MLSNSWEWFSLLWQWATYIAVVSAAGGVLNRALLPASVERALSWRAYVLSACGLGIVAVSFGFLSRVGAIANAGLGGMWNATFFPILAQSPVGDAAALRLLALVLIAAGIVLPTLKHAVRWLQKFALTAGVVLLLVSFAITGHVAELNSVARVLIVLHVAGAAFWLGGLFPLWRACNHLPGNELRSVMEKFSHVALAVVLLLLTLGIWLAMLLLPTVDALFTSQYGRWLLVKLCGVGVLLGLACANKFYWLKRLNIPSGLRLSIQWEIVVGLGVLGATAILATTTGPNH